MSWWWQQTDEYDPIKAGSIDATDTRPHDHAIIRATQAYYDASRDPKISGDPKATLIFARVAFDTTEETLRAFFSKYGPIKSFRLVRHIVTGASRGYGFVEYEKEADTKAAFFGAQRAVIDGRQIMVDFERCRTMSGWIPRRLGGGLGGRKESGQLRFGGRDRPFRRPIVVNTPEAEWAVKMMNRSKSNDGRSGARSADGWREKDSSNYDRRDSSHRSHHHHHHHSEERRDERRDRYDRHEHHRDRQHDDHDDRERHRHHHSSHHDKDRSRSRH